MPYELLNLVIAFEPVSGGKVREIPRKGVFKGR